MKKTLSLFNIFLVLLFIFFIIGFYTFYNAKGTSYLSSASESCNNCHIMNEVYNEYMQGPHSKKFKGEPRATCVDCHLPHEFFAKWIAKAQSGLGHAYAFTFKLDELPTNLSANNKSREIIQQNCIHCHADFTQTAINATTNPHAHDSLKCISCHKDVGHKHGI
ncbi:cytochrome c nitrite reductase small subunit [Campylobacter molothri]|uniref:cytochrome c nitrite reductase small subunit n=1 Tax=Campylobacter molothri TaxID=1032242 RepID=UPI00301DBAFB|nr:cytochrome c nitrite reductase small subunit [Campylobacter sp. W0067]MBZ7962857.1 cytochrome c nitrite reductase small subunit [Campylobacter sp. W0049]